MNANKLIVRCKENPDWNGTWHKSETIAELKELGIIEENWIEYVLSHLFDFGGSAIKADIFNMIANDDSVSSIIFNHEGCGVEITKVN